MSFVSENNSLSGYKTCIEALKHPMYTWLRRVTSGLRRCSIQDSRMVIALPILRLHHPGTWNNMTFLISSSSSEFSRSDAGVLWCSPPPPQHVGLKRSREFSHGSVLCLGFLASVSYLWGEVFIDDCFHFSPGRGLSLSHAAEAWQRLQTRSLEKVSWGLFLSASPAKAEPHPTCGFSGILLFSGALATAAAIFISLPKI